MIEKVKKLLNRLRGGKIKRTPREIVLSYKKNISPSKIEIVHQEKNQNISGNAINIKNHDDWQEIMTRLYNLSQFEQFQNLQWLKVRLDNVRSELGKIKIPENFDDEELNFNLAKKIKSVASIMLDILQNCNSSTNISDYDRKNLKNAVEEYLKSLDIEQIKFFAGDLYENWAELGMEDSFIIATTYDRNLHNRIKNVEIQPRIIYYVENDEIEKIIFGGICTAYKFKEV